MYYQADLEHSNRLFKLFLVLSIVVHAGVLFYKKNRSTLILATTSPFPTEQSLKVRLQEVMRPKQKVVKKKVVKKKTLTKKKVATAKPIKPKEVQEEQETSQPQTRSFKSAIKNYVKPHYPRLAIRKEITGQVRLTLWIKGSGELDKVLIAESSGHRMLDQSALDAAKRWTFNKLSPQADKLFKVSRLVVYKFN